MRRNFLLIAVVLMFGVAASLAAQAKPDFSGKWVADAAAAPAAPAGRGGGEPTAQVSKAVWDGAKLVVTTTINAGGNNIEQKRVFAMEGANLTIETTQPGRDGGPGTPNKVTYKKG